ncbi:MAG: DUF3592 domain-containing protein [Rhizobacter sp.]|nr:DUF3592 domain-containing protein [Ferruginibacter sp.]
MNPINITAVVIMLLAAASPFICIVKMRINKRFRQTAIETTAQIFDVEKRTGHKSTYYIIKFHYKTIDKNIEYTGQTVFGNKNKTGEEITIWYKADNPAVFKTDTSKSLRWALAFSLLFFGLVSWLSIWLLTQTYTYRPG